MWNKNGLLNLKESDRILVVAPHADDECIGCGGLLLKYAAQTDVLLLSDGRFGYDPSDPDASPEKTRILRQNEFKSVMSFLNVRKYTMLDIQNGDVYRHYSVVREYDIREYDFIFVPSRFENNHDHLSAFYYLRKMIRAQHAKARLIEYEVWVPIPDPQVILDIEDVIERKKQALSMYESQLKCYDYINFAYGLNLYRGGRFQTALRRSIFRAAETLSSEDSGQASDDLRIPKESQKTLFGFKGQKELNAAAEKAAERLVVMRGKGRGRRNAPCVSPHQSSKPA